MDGNGTMARRTDLLREEERGCMVVLDGVERPWFARLLPTRRRSANSSADHPITLRRAISAISSRPEAQTSGTTVTATGAGTIASAAPVIVSNPKGYSTRGRAENGRFGPGLVIEIEGVRA
ncbi:hypothetical protein RHODGE_RHODGE_03533 [Rhodoplanes serenus]|uniref:Uncharacterized protein n=1 Tax=Rhodoplanes serenus TaxID=200615 RepID=A0A447CYK2_9BRAD|nr:hypothetical protein RHODGE_RHODGE_03533 [Rhodoplanes serenus]